MLYGFTSKNLLIVSAASSMVELQLWIDSVRDTNPFEPSTPLDKHRVSELEDFEHGVFIGEFSSNSEAESFAEQHNIELVDPLTASMAQTAMEGVDETDPRTIAEMYDIVHDDKWDAAEDINGGRLRDDVIKDQFRSIATTKSGINISDIKVTSTGEVVVHVNENAGPPLPSILFLEYEMPENPSIDTVLSDLMERLKATKTPQRVAKIEERLRKETKRPDFALKTLINNVMNSIIRDQVDKIMERKDFNPDPTSEFDRISREIDAIDNIDPTAAEAFKEIAHEHLHAGQVVRNDTIRFAKNEKFTENPVFGGKNVPVYHFRSTLDHLDLDGKEDEEGNISVDALIADHMSAIGEGEEVSDDGKSKVFYTKEDMIKYLDLRYGFTFINDDIFVYSVNPTNPNYETDLDAYLESQGMLKDDSIIQQVQRYTPTENEPEVSDEEFARYFDMEAAKLPVNTYAEGSTYGLESSKELEQQDKKLQRVRISSLDETLRNMLRSVDDDTILYGDYNGPYINDRAAMFVVMNNDRVISDACLNVIPMGGIRNREASSVIVAQRNLAGIGILTLRTDEGVKMYRINAPQPSEE